MEQWERKYTEGEYVYDPTPFLPYKRLRYEELRAAWSNLVINRPNLTFGAFIAMVHPELAEDIPDENEDV